MPSLAQILATVGQGRGLPQRFRPFANQAANEAFLRFAPKWEGLNALREQSAGTMRQGITQATSAAQLNAALARQGAKDFGGLPANPLPYEGAPGSSAAIAATNRGLTREATINMLATAASNAPIAGAQQVRQLTDVHADDLAKINSQRASLGGQVGAFVQGRLGSLIGEDRKSRAAVNAQRRSLEVQLRGQDVSAETTRRGQDISHTDRAADRAAADRRAAAKPKGKDPHGNTVKDRRAAQDSYDRALTMARTTGGKDWRKLKDFLIFKNVNPVMAQAAAQQAALGYVGGTTATRLRNRGVSRGFNTQTNRPGRPRPSNVTPGPPGTTGTRPT